MKMKKLFSLTTATVLLLCSGTFFGCKELSDIAPTSYGAWDGNYIYRGNVRSKTTGEDSEYLVTELTIDGVDYQVTGTTDFAYYEEDIYLCLTVASNGGDEQPDMGDEGIVTYDVLPPVEDEPIEIFSCFVRYSPLDKSTEVFRVGSSAWYNIFTVQEEGVVLKGGDGWVMLDHIGNVIDADASEYANYRYYGKNKEYIVDKNGNEWLYRTWEQEEFVKFHEGDFDELRLLDKGEVKGFLIIDNAAYNGYAIGAQSAWFYDFARGETTTFLSQNEGRCFKLSMQANRDYFITSEKKEFPYTARMGRDQVELSETLHVNCKLYKIDWSANGVTFEHVYNFDGNMANKDFTEMYPKEDGNLYFKAKWVKIGGGCRGESGVQTTSYQLNPKTGKLLVKSFSTSSASNDEPIYENAVECGKYIYFSDGESYGGGLWAHGHATYYIKRYDEETGEETVMQFWIEEGGEMENATTEDGEPIEFRFSKEMWADVNYDAEVYIAPDRFIVLGY